MTSLTVDYVHDVIDRVLQLTEVQAGPLATSKKASTWAANKSLTWRRATQPGRDWVKRGGSPDNPSLSQHRIPFYFGIQASRHDEADEERDEEPTFTTHCTFYLAYSTWDGRMLNVDQLGGKGSDSCSADVVMAFYRILAKIAVQLQCGRLCWKVRHSQPER